MTAKVQSINCNQILLSQIMASSCRPSPQRSTNQMLFGTCYITLTFTIYLVIHSMVLTSVLYQIHSATTCHFSVTGVKFVCSLIDSSSPDVQCICLTKTTTMQLLLSSTTPSDGTDPSGRPHHTRLRAFSPILDLPMHGRRQPLKQLAFSCELKNSMP